MYTWNADYCLRCFEYLASDMTVAEVLDDFPELTESDIQACFAYAAEKEKNTGHHIKECVRNANAGILVL